MAGRASDMEVEELDVAAGSRGKKSRPQHFDCDSCLTSKTGSHAWVTEAGSLYFCSNCQAAGLHLKCIEFYWMCTEGEKFGGKLIFH